MDDEEERESFLQSELSRPPTDPMDTGRNNSAVSRYFMYMYICTVCTVSLSNSRAKGARHSGCFKETNISDMERERGYMRSNIRSFLGPEYYLITIKKIYKSFFMHKL